MKTVWILVCDSARGRLFETRGDDPTWILLEVVGNEGSRSRASALVTDQSGQRSAEGGSVHHNALAPSSSPKENEKHHFLHSLANKLDQACRARRFDGLVLVAPPHALGILKKELTPALEKCLMSTMDKDLTHVDGEELAARLRGSVHIPVSSRDVVRDVTKHAH